VSPPPARIPRVSLAGLALLVVFCVCWRWHTFGPSVRATDGVTLSWPDASQTEPLDCDEAYYAHIGRVVAQGGTLYVDVSENKPPLGYLLYAAAVWLGGYNEAAIRVLPIPFVVATLVIVWWNSRRLAGDAAAFVSALLYALVSCDPSIYGNGTQLEQFMNLGTTGCLAFLMTGTPGRRRIALSGAFLGLAILVKQVALLPALPAAVYLLASPGGEGRRRLAARVADLASFGAGIAAPIALAAAWLIASGAAWAAYDDIFIFGAALATDTLPDPLAPSPVVRWFTGNSDPAGVLPPPFGKTNYLVWWAGGTWPFWLLAALAWIRLAFPPYRARRLLLLGWIAACWAMVVAPGLYWAHYYVLPVPASALAIGLFLSDLTASRPVSSRATRLARVATLVALGLLILGLVALQTHHYLLTSPVQLTERYKGGRQWVVLREQARQMRRRAAEWESPRLLVWGWQSPLYFYGQFDAASRHAFTNNLMRDHAGKAHPIVGPRIRELMEDLRSEPPEFIATGYPPFPDLRAFLGERYLPSRYPGAVPIWVRRDLWASYETETVSTQVGRWRREQERTPRPSR
jgi:4-amino-4-deoxy-L-arabinose transferase-like glycosyltransferase